MQPQSAVRKKATPVRRQRLSPVRLPPATATTQARGEARRLWSLEQIHHPHLWAGKSIRAPWLGTVLTVAARCGRCSTSRIGPAAANFSSLCPDRTSSRERALAPIPWGHHGHHPLRQAGDAWVLPAWQLEAEHLDGVWERCVRRERSMGAQRGRLLQASGRGCRRHSSRPLVDPLSAGARRRPSSGAVGGVPSVSSISGHQRPIGPRRRAGAGGSSWSALSPTPWRRQPLPHPVSVSSSAARSR